MESCRLIKSEMDHDCGCTEEEWDTPIGLAFVHIAPCFKGDVFFDNGDAGEWEIEIKGDSQIDFKDKLSEYINTFPKFTN